MFMLAYSFFIFGILTSIILFFRRGVFKKSEVSGLSWSRPYECGFCSNSLRMKFFRFTYFSLLVFFVVFDLEISLLLNLPEQGLLFKNFPFYFLFLFILTLGFIAEVLVGYVQ